MSQHTVTLVPYGGLANRMKAIEAMIALVSEADIDAHVIWFKDKGLNCSFDELFQPIHIPRLNLREAKPADHIFIDRPRKRNLFIPLFFENMHFDSCLHENEVTQNTYRNFDFKKWILSHKKTYLSACLQFHPSDIRYRFNSFISTQCLQEQIDEGCRKLNAHTVGIHIRRTDNVLSIKESPTELFINRMEKEIEIQPDVQFYLASDSLDEKRRLISVFGDRIITSWGETSRQSPEGIKEALIELYTLSKTRKILGSHYSSYSQTAAEIGKIPYVEVKM